MFYFISLSVYAFKYALLLLCSLQIKYFKPLSFPKSKNIIIV